MKPTRTRQSTAKSFLKHNSNMRYSNVMNTINSLQLSASNTFSSPTLTPNKKHVPVRRFRFEVLKTALENKAFPIVKVTIPQRTLETFDEM